MVIEKKGGSMAGDKRKEEWPSIQKKGIWARTRPSQEGRGVVGGKS